jgi:short subunit dehydrogenase-like uncharacterized protein
MPSGLLIYGATGYSGRLVAQAASAVGLSPCLAGRDARRLAELAETLGVEHRVVGLDDPTALARGLDGMQAVIHAAGPFAATARPMIDACLATGVHYLDITGEVQVIEGLVARDAEARRRGIMVMPGVGFDVVASDCLAAHVAQQLPQAERLAVGLAGFAALSRGSAQTLVGMGDCGVVRRDGVLRPVPLGSLRRRFDYGAGERMSLNVSWADVTTAYYTTGIPNIETYVEGTPLVTGLLGVHRALAPLLGTAAWQTWAGAWTALLAPGPSAADRAARRMAIVAEATHRDGRRAAARLGTPEAYTFTAFAAVAIARRVLARDLETGFQTPARVYGGDFVLGLPDVVREDLT